jgi:pyruvate-ferredoxin/flavodoxin oxidoreductase
MALSYGHVYVASIAFGASDNQTVKAIQEAEAYPGPALIIAYSHCIAHGFDLRFGGEQQKRAVQSGIWPLFRYDPRLVLRGESALQLDSGPRKFTVEEYMAGEARFRMVEAIDRHRFKRLARAATHNAAMRNDLYKQLAQMHLTAHLETAGQ